MIRSSTASTTEASTVRPRLTERYRAFLPLTPATPPLSLGEGFTPLVRAARLGEQLGLERLYLKLEGANPTGSFKDRGMVVAVARAIEGGARAVICASTGNTSASASAYGAAAGLDVVVVVPKGRVARGKLLQVLSCGARVVAVEGSFDEALRIVRRLAEQLTGSAVLVNSVNRDRIEGQKTAAFEICEDLGGPPDVLAIPVGNAGNITAYWAGFREFALAGRISRLPRLFGFQAAGAAPLVLGRRVEHPETIASAIRIGDPASWGGAVQARDESGGLIEAVTDEEILAAYRTLATLEGVFCEPASAAAVAGITRLVGENRLDRSISIACVITGTGLKDPETAESLAGEVLEAEPNPGAVARALGW